MTEKSNPLKSHFRPCWAAVALLSLVIVLTLTHIPQDALPKALQRNLLDKFEHVGAYGMITAFAILSLKRPVRVPLLLMILGSLGVIGVLDELTQPFFNRSASAGDYAADLVGMTMACVIVLVGRLVCVPKRSA